MQTSSDPRCQFERNRWVVRVLVFLTMCGSGWAKGERYHPLEQTEFSAEDASVHNPIEIPRAVMTILGKDHWVHNALENESIPSEKLPPSWFSASTIHLGSANELDLVVVGEGPLAGANVVTFWLFLATPHGYELVLTQSAHDLTIETTRHKGYRDIEASTESAITFCSALFKFDGNTYSKRSGKTEQLH